MKILLALALLFIPLSSFARGACHQGYNCKGRVLYRIPGDTAIAEECLAAGGNSVSSPSQKRCYNIAPGAPAPAPAKPACVNIGTTCLETRCECCSGNTVMIGNVCI